LRWGLGSPIFGLVEVKGTALRSILVALEALEGAEGLARVRNAMPEGARARIDPIVLGARWYPVAVQAAIHEAIRLEIGKGRVDANYRVARRAAMDDFAGGVYRIFLRTITYDALWDTTARIWRQYNSRGSLSFPERRREMARGHVVGVEGYTLAMWTGVCGRFHGILEIAGAKDVEVVVESHDETQCVLRARFVP
jgi:hypothetical protein